MVSRSRIFGDFDLNLSLGLKYVYNKIKIMEGQLFTLRVFIETLKLRSENHIRRKE